MRIFITKIIKFSICLSAVLAVTTCFSETAFGQMRPGMAPKLTKEQAQKVAPGVKERFFASGKTPPKLDSRRYRMMLDLFQTAEDQDGVEKTVAAWYETWSGDEQSRKSTSAGDTAILGRYLKRLGRNSEAAELAVYVENLLKSKPGKDNVKITVTQLADYDDLAATTNSAALQRAIKEKIEKLTSKDGSLRRDLAPMELRALAATYRRAKDTASQKQLAEFIVNDYLPQPGLTNALSSDQWLALARIVRSSKAPAAAKTFCNLFSRELAANNIRVGSFSHPQLLELTGLLNQMGVEKSISKTLVPQWLNIPKDDWAKVSPTLQEKLISAAMGSSSKTVEDFLTASAGDNGQKINQSDYRAAVALLHRTAGAKIARKIAGQAVTAFVAARSPSIGDLNNIAITLKKGADVTNETLAAFIDKLGTFEDRSVQLPDETCKNLAKFMKSKPDSINMLKSRRVAANLELNTPVVKVLWWYYRGGDNYIRYYHSFGRMLRQRRSKLKGDKLAKWEITYAYVRSLLDKWGQRPMDAKTVAKALAAAESDEMRLRCVEEVALAGQRTRNVKQAIQIAQSIQNQLTTPAGKEHLKNLQASLQQDQARWDGEAAKRGEKSRNYQRWAQIFQNAQRNERQFSMNQQRRRR